MPPPIDGIPQSLQSLQTRATPDTDMMAKSGNCGKYILLIQKEYLSVRLNVVHRHILA